MFPNPEELGFPNSGYSEFNSVGTALAYTQDQFAIEISEPNILHNFVNSGPITWKAYHL